MPVKLRGKEEDRVRKEGRVQSEKDSKGDDLEDVIILKTDTRLMNIGRRGRYHCLSWSAPPC